MRKFDQYQQSDKDQKLLKKKYYQNILSIIS